MTSVQGSPTRLLVVRHGESEANRDQRFDCSVPGPPLTQVGRRQAGRLVDVVADGSAGRPIRAVVASSMLRARQTAEPLARSVHRPVAVLRDLREVHKGDLHLRSDPESHRLADELTARWAAGDLEARRPDGETARAAIDRFVAALVQAAGLGDMGPSRTQLLETGLPVTGRPEAVVVVSHAGIMRLALTALLTRAGGPGAGADGAVGAVLALPNLAMIELEVVAGDVRLARRVHPHGRNIQALRAW